jgi:uncharacterized protein YdaU (DUF1376 family)
VVRVVAKKQKKPEPFLPMFVGDFFAATAEWEGEEESLYALLLMRQWSLGHLPVEVAKLARLVKYDPRTFERWWPTVASKFEAVEVPGKGLRFVNVRLEKHREKTRALSEKNAKAGKLGADNKWRKDGERHASGIANANGVDGERHKSVITSRHPKNDGVTHGNPSHPIPSHPDPSGVLPPSSQDSDVHTPNPGTGNRNSSVSGEVNRREQISDAEQHEIFLDAQRRYPGSLSRGDHWTLAERAIRKLLNDGEPAALILANTDLYCAQQTALGTLGTENVLRSNTFFGSDAWRGPFPIPQKKQTGADREVEKFMRRGGES